MISATSMYHNEEDVRKEEYLDCQDYQLGVSFTFIHRRQSRRGLTRRNSNETV